jgi:hypothetical protein
VTVAATPSRRFLAVSAALFVAFLVPFVWFALVFDVFAAGNGPAQARALQIGVAFAASAPALAVVWVCRRRWMTTTYVAACAVVLVLAFVPWHPRKRFVWDLHSVEPGMTVDEVEAVMGRYMKGAGKKWAVPGVSEALVVAPAFPAADERAHATGTMTYRWDDSDGGYDSDWGQVTFADGRVVEVRFLPD